MTKHLKPTTFLLIIILILIEAYTLKHSKDKKQQAATISSPASVAPVMTPISKVDPTPPSPPSAPQQQIQPQPQSTLSQPSPTPESPKVGSLKDGGTLLYEAGQNWFRVPVTVNETKYNIGILYGSQKKVVNFPSWIFTSLTEKHQLCDCNQDCQDDVDFVNCEKDSKKSGSCVDAGKAKYSDDAIQSKRKAKIIITNNNSSFIQEFVSPSKINLQDSQVSENELQGMLNLSPYSLSIKKSSIKLTSQPITALLPKDPELPPSIDFQKQGLLALTDSKSLYIRTKASSTSSTSSKPSNNIKLSYKRVRVAFDQKETSMSVPKDMLITIKNILKKEYFGDRCKIKDEEVVCSGEPVRKFASVGLCRDSDGKQCLELDVIGYILEQVKAGVNFKFIINENKEVEDEIIIYPKLAQKYDIYCQKGEVKALILSKQNQQMTASNDNKNQQSAKVAEQQSEKESESEEEEKKEEEEKQSKNLKKQTKEKQKQAEKEKQESEEQQQQQEQTQKQDKQKKDGHQKQQEKKKNKKQQEKAKTTKEKNKNQKKQEVQQDEDEDENENESEDEKDKSKQKQQKNSRNKINHKASSKSKGKDSKDSQQGSIQDEKKYSKGILFFVFAYGGVFIAILVIIKLKASESFAAGAIDRFLQVTWYSIIRNYFNKAKGYNAPIEEEEEGKGHQQVDRNDSIAVGYRYQDGKTLFWENNSVEGI